MRTTNSGLQKLSRMSECKQRFGIRKLTVGTVSVLLGTTLWLGRNATVAHAADNDVDNAEGVKQTTNSNVATPHVDENTQVKVEASHVDETTQPKAETTNVDVNTQPKVEATQASANTPAKTEVSSQNNVASTKIPANSVKTGDNTTNQQSSAAAQVTSNNSNKTNVEQTEKSNKNEQTTTILNVAANKSALVKGNQTLIRQARALEQSNVETDSDNGGFDSDKWGNLDISDWQGEENQDGIYQLTDYTGDYDHIIVPNGADFRNAGTDVDQVGVTSDFMHRLFMGADSDSATVAFSGTDDEKVKAIDDEDTKHPGDWSNTWGHGPENDQVQDPEDQETQATARLAYFDGSNLDVSGVTNMSYMFADNNLDDISSLADWDTSNVKNTQSMFWHNKISDLSPVSDWNIGNMTGMDSMFATNQISDLTPVSNWNTSNVTDMKNLFFKNSISDLTPISGWNTSSVDNMDGMFQHNPITRADFSGWDFSHLVRKDYHQTKKPYSTLDGFIDSDARAIVNMGSNDTLPDWVLDSQIKDDDDSTTDEDTELRNDSIFSTSNGNHLILTSDSKLLNNPNNAHNTITFSNSDESINDTVDMPVFIDSSFDTVLDDVKSLADQKVNDEETKIGSRYNIGIDSSVDQNDAISLANAKYDITPAPVTPVDPDTPTNPTNPSTPEVRITFNDVDPNAAQDSDDVKSLLATPIVLSQKDPDNDDIDLSNVTIPENFVLAESLPTDKKYGVDTAVVLDVRHILQDVSDTDPNAKTTVKRTIIVTEPNKGDQDMSQTLTLHRSAMKDLVTNNVEYGTWNTSSFAEVAVPKVENYTPSQETVPAVETVTADYIDPNIHVVYTVNNSDDSTQIISYVRDDNGAEVGQQVVSGKVGDTFQITPELPDGWERTKDKPVNITIRPNGEGTVIVVPVDPLKVTINPDDLPAGKEIWGTNEHDVSNADVLAGTKSKYSKRDVTYNDLHGAVSRTVEIMNPDGNLAPESRVQLVKFKRSAIINAIDGSVTFTNWIPDGKTSLSEIDVPVIAGYTPTQTKVDQVDNISTDYVDPRIFITYTGNKNSQSIVYKDQNGNVIGKQTIDGQNGQTVNVNAAIPDGWKVLNNEIIPKEITIKPNNSDINITVKATTSVVDPNEVDKDKPISKDAVISGTKNKHLEHDITYNDLHKDVTRTVTINRPDGVVVPVTQTVHFVRSANVDNTTGKITYTNWTAEDNDNFAKVDVPQIDGYTANESNVGQVANVTSDYADPKISVTYTPKDVTKTITFVDGKGNVIGKQTVAGKTNEVKDVTLKAPDGWQLDSDKALNKVTLDTNNDPISVFVEPKTALIKSDEVKQNQSFTKNDVLPGTESKHANKDITYDDLHKSVDRKIEITMPDGSQKTINQTVYFERNATVNTATGDVNFGNWNVVGADKLDKADIPQIENYIPSGDAFAINYLNYDEDPKDVKITYVADTPANRLAVAKQNLASVQDAKNELKDNLAKLEQEQDSIVKQDKAIQDEYNAKKEQNKVLLVAADAAESALDEEIADHSSDVNLAKADKVVNDFFNQINDKKNVLSAQNKKLSDLNQNKASVEKKVNDLNDSLNKVSDEIAVKQKEIEADQDEINKLSVSAETDFNLSDKYIKYIKGYNSQLDKEYDQTYKDAYNDIYNKEYEAYKKQYPESIYGKEQIERLAKSNAENKAKAGASQKAVTAVKNLIKKLTPDFYDNMKKIGDEMMEQEHKDKTTKGNVIWSQKDKDTKVDLDHLTEDQKHEINDYAYNLLNSARKKLGLPLLEHNSSTEDFAQKIAEQYVKHGRTHLDGQGHYYQGINKVAKEYGLSVPSAPNPEKPNSENTNNTQYYESLDHWFSSRNYDAVPINNNEGYYIVPVPDTDSNSHMTDMDSIKKGIYANLISMLINDDWTNIGASLARANSDHSWGHTEHLLSIGNDKDWYSTNPRYRFGMSTGVLHLLDSTGKDTSKDAGGGYTQHFIIISDSEAKNSKIEDTDKRPIGSNVADPSKLKAAIEKLNKDKAALKDLNNKKDEIQRNLDDAHGDLNNINNLIAATQKAIKQDNGQVDVLTKNLINAQNDQSKAKDAVAKHNNTIDEKRKAANDARNKAQKSQSELNDLKTKADLSTQKVKDINQRVDNLKKRDIELDTFVQKDSNAVKDVEKNNQNSNNSQATNEVVPKPETTQETPAPTTQKSTDTQTSTENTPDVNNDDNNETDSDTDSDEDQDYEPVSRNSRASKRSGSHSANTGVKPTNISHQAAQNYNVHGESLGNNNSEKVVEGKKQLSSNNAQSQLPETGESEDTAAIVAGSLAASLSLIGLMGVKKRRKE